MSTSPEQDFVFKTINSRDVHFVRCWFTDVLGNLKSFAVIPDELDEAFANGISFDGNCIEGFAGTDHYDLLAFPVASTFQVLPWRPDSNAVARMFCSIHTHTSNPFEGDTRNVLKQIVDKAADQGYIFNVRPKPEFYYFKDAEGVEPLDRGGYFDLTSLDYASDLRRDTVLTLEMMGIPVEYSHHEKGPSQHEIDLRPTDALSMADALLTYKLVVKEIAMKYGSHASFMPKPIENEFGSGMFIQQTLFDREGNNIFFNEDHTGDYSLSQIAKHYIAGLLKYAPEYTVVTNQYVNSYKRLAADSEVPTCVSWGKKSRSVLVRAQEGIASGESSFCVELRSPDPAVNPYLAFAVMLAAGMKGIEDQLELPEPVEDNKVAQLPRNELKQQGFELLPENLGEAVELFAASDFMKEILGEHIHSYLVHVKRQEWNDYQHFVSAWEHNRYLAIL